MCNDITNVYLVCFETQIQSSDNALCICYSVSVKQMTYMGVA